MELQNSNWGGVREGAGRKKTKARNTGFRCTQEASDVLDKLSMSKTDFINEAIMFYAKEKGLI